MKIITPTETVKILNLLGADVDIVEAVALETNKVGYYIDNHRILEIVMCFVTTPHTCVCWFDEDNYNKFY